MIVKTIKNLENKMEKMQESFNKDLEELKNKYTETNDTITEIKHTLGFPGGSEVKASASNVGNLGSIPGSGRCPGEGNGNPLQYSCLENPLDGGAWLATVHGVAKSRTRLSDFTFIPILDFPGSAHGKELSCQCRRHRRHKFDP